MKLRCLILATSLLAACHAPAPAPPLPPPAAALAIRGDRVPGAPEKGVGGCEIRRDARGRIIRSEAVLREFKRQTGWPHGRPGFQIDHVWPLKRGGCDCVQNLQWLSVAVKREKDRLE